MSEKDVRLIRRLWRAPKLPGLEKCSKWGYVMGGYIRTLTKQINKLFYSFVGWIPDMCETCLISYLKEVSRLSLELVLEQNQRWLLPFLDLKVLGGFDTEVNRQDPFAEYKKDYGTEVEPPSSRVEYWIDDTISKIGIKQVDYEFEEFVSFRDAWALPGASVQGTAKKVQIVGSDKSRKEIRVKDKWFATAHLTDDEIIKQCKSDKEVVVRPFVKQDEPAACRTVQCYDTWSLVRCSYLDQAIGDLNAHGEWTSVGMGSEEKQRLRRKIMYHNRGWKLCTDQSGFDTHQPRKWVIYVVKKLLEKIVGVNPHMSEIADLEIDSLGRVVLEYNGITMEWLNAVLSGYKFTALVDSILNRAETREVLERLDRSDILMECYQGDDAIVVLSQAIDKASVSMAYASINLEVNPDKTWMTNGNTEFLHEIYFREKVVAFPARAFRAIAWKKPLSNIMLGELGIDKFQSLMGVMRMALRRGLVVYDMTLRVVKQYGLSEKHFREWWRTPYVLGGFGAGRSGRMALQHESLSVGKVTFRIHVSGIAHRSKGMQSAARSRAKGSLPVPGKRLKLSWEAVAGCRSMDPLQAANLEGEARPKIDWTLADLGKVSDAYERKLNLELKLESREKITPDDLPGFFGYFRNFDGAYRKYRKIINDRVGLDFSFTAGETFYQVSDWANHIWSGMCYRKIRKRDSDLDWAPLARLVHRKTMDHLRHGGSLRVCV
jgi:hypothetical protein